MVSTRGFTFEKSESFVRWMGPFSPARGTRKGLRFHYGRIGAWVDYGFWPLVQTSGVTELERVVLRRWGGGRVLLLPWGDVIKPLQAEDEVGKRVLIGKFSGPVVFELPDGSHLSLGDAEGWDAGEPWPGPHHVGLECTIDTTGSLKCTWYHPTKWGRTSESQILWGADRRLAAGFRKARPGDDGGRVHVLPGGIVVTNAWIGGRWQARFVGRVDPRGVALRAGWLLGGGDYE